jgi:DNA-binding transcriptional LysR family regulator
VTQPAVSQAIRALERYYGVALFKKSGRNMELTHAGRLLYGYAEQIDHVTQQAEQTMRELARAERGELRVAANKIFARYIMPSVVAAFRDRYPGIELVLNEGSSEEMVASVDRLANHLAVVGRVPYPPRIRAQHFRRVELVLAAGAGHALSGRSAISLQELEDQPVVIREQGSSSRLAVIERFAREGVRLRVAMESGSVDFIKEYVAEGRGLAFLYEPEVRAELESGRLVKIALKGGNLELHTDVVFLAEAYQSPAVRAFLSVLEEIGTADWSELART